MARKRKPFSLNRDQARALSFAFTADATARAMLAGGGTMEDYNVWSGMCDEKLVELFGRNLKELHNFGHDKSW